MTRRATTALFLGLAAFCWVGQPAQGQMRPAPAGGKQKAAAAPAAVEVRTSVNRTAVWLGDRVTYTIELRCAPGVDILLDDLSKERLPITGGEVAGVEAERQERNGGTTHRFRFTLVTHQVDAAAIVIAPTAVRYYATGQRERAGAAAPSGQIAVPALAIAVRSTLPASGAAIALRPPAEPRSTPAYLRFAERAGLALLLIAVLPLALGSLDLARRIRALRAGYQARQTRRTQRGSFEQVRDLEPSSDAARIEAYERLDAFIREHLDAVIGIPARSLTPDEVRREVEARATWLAPHDVGGLLDACERARYDREPPTASDWAEAVRRAAQVLSARR